MFHRNSNPNYGSEVLAVGGSKTASGEGTDPNRVVYACYCKLFTMSNQYLNIKSVT